MIKEEEFKMLLDEFEILLNARINSDMSLLSDYEKGYFKSKIKKMREQINDILM